MYTQEKYNPHEGHRKRLRDSIIKSGIYNISDLHFLEYLLTFTIPRSDTNPIAHSLLKEFGSLKAVFEASYESLIKISGVGDKTARFLQLMSVSAFLYNRSKLAKYPKLENLRETYEYICTVLPPSINEQFIIILLNKDYSVKSYKIFEGVSHSFVVLDFHKLSEFLVSQKACYAIFAHTHPYHTATPSEKDLESFSKISNLTQIFGIKIIDNIIIGKDDIFTTRLQTVYKLEDISGINYKK